MVFSLIFLFSFVDIVQRLKEALQIFSEGIADTTELREFGAHSYKTFRHLFKRLTLLF